jgi:hypothetical protein
MLQGRKLMNLRPMKLIVDRIFILLITLVLLGPPESLANQNISSQKRLENALEGLKLKAQSNSLSSDYIQQFINIHKDELTKKNLLPSFQKILGSTNKFANCQSGDISRQVNESFMSGLNVCNEQGQLDFSQIEKLALDLEKISGDLDKSQEELGKQMKVLADEIYTAQRAMYIGNSYIAYNKYIKPGISLEEFMQEWRYTKAKNPGNVHQVDGKGIIDLDSEWKGMAEKASLRIKENSPNAKENLNELVIDANGKLQTIYKNKRSLEKERGLDEKLKKEIAQNGFLLAPHESFDFSLEKNARDAVLADPYTQPFNSTFFSRGLAPTKQDFDLDKIQKDIEDRNWQSFRGHEETKSSSEVAYYMNVVKKIHGEDVILIDDVHYKEGENVKIIPTVTGSSAINKFSAYGLNAETARYHDQLLHSAVDQKIKPVMAGETKVIPLSQIWGLHRDLGRDSKLSGDLQQLSYKQFQKFRTEQGKHQDAVIDLQQSSARDLILGSNIGHYERAPLVEHFVFGVGPKKVSSSATRSIDAQAGLAEHELLKSDEALMMLKQHLGQTSELMSHFDDLYDQAMSGKKPENYVKDALHFHPALVSKIVANKPEFAGALCAMSRVNAEDKERQKKRDAIIGQIAAVAAIVTIVATAGAGLIAVAGVGGTAGALFTATASTIGLGMTAGTAAASFNRYQELQAEHETANRMFSGTGQVFGLEGAEAQAEVADLYKQAQANLDQAIIEGAMAPLDALDFYTAVKGLDNLTQLKTLAQSPGEVVSFVKNAQKAEPRSLLGASTLRTKEAREADLIAKHGKDYVKNIEANARLERPERLAKIEETLADQVDLSKIPPADKIKLEDELIAIHKRGTVLETDTRVLSQKITDAQRAIRDSTGVVVPRKVIEDRLVRQGLLGQVDLDANAEALKKFSSNPALQESQRHIIALAKKNPGKGSTDLKNLELLQRRQEEMLTTLETLEKLKLEAINPATSAERLLELEKGIERQTENAIQQADKLDTFLGMNNMGKVDLAQVERSVRAPSSAPANNAPVKPAVISNPTSAPKTRELVEESKKGLSQEAVSLRKNQEQYDAFLDGKKQFKTDGEEEAFINAYQAENRRAVGSILIQAENRLKELQDNPRLIADLANNDAGLTRALKEKVEAKLKTVSALHRDYKKDQDAVIANEAFLRQVEEFLNLN